MAEVAGAFYALENVVEGAVAFGMAILHPTLPLKATLTRIPAIGLARSKHTVSVVKGRAYVFGGTCQDGEGIKRLANNDMHVIILPSSGIAAADYKNIPPRGDAPAARLGHTASVIDDCIYIHGGSAGFNEDPIEESGRVWVFDTSLSTWSCLHPSESSELPAPRSNHASATSEFPQPTAPRTDEGYMPQRPPDPADVVPEPPAANSYGTLFIYGGTAGAEQSPLTDILAFDIRSRTWTPFSSPTSAATSKPSLASIDNRLYSFSGDRAEFLDISDGTPTDKGGTSDLRLVPQGEWSTINLPSDSSFRKRSGAVIIPVTTGQGRNYLLLLGGEVGSTEKGSDAASDIWALQLKTESMTAASFKDATRTAIKKPTEESQWAEVKYYDEDGKMIQEGQPGRGLGDRRDFAAAKGSEIDGCTALIWGGTNDDGKVVEEGLMVTVDR
ncbi:hypothetical protein LTR50_000251 [Elasticomyces elasticus]|nr:hypothetical protein LTR50_000251 [Elasticomyces elasticus]